MIESANKKLDAINKEIIRSDKMLSFERKYYDSSKEKMIRVLISVNRTDKNIELNILKDYENSRIIYAQNAKENELFEYGILIQIFE